MITKLLIVVFSFSLFAFHSPVFAVSPTPTIKPVATGTTAPMPTAADDEKVKEIRDAIKEKVNEIKEKIEKRAYVGIISQITDSTITLDNFRGKQRARLTSATTIIGADKREIKAKDLALEDKVITMGDLGENEILEAKRVLVVPKPKTTPLKRTIFIGTITAINGRTAIITVTDLKDPDTSLDFAVDKDTYLALVGNAKGTPKFADLKDSQRVVVVHLLSPDSKTIHAKSVFILP